MTWASTTGGYVNSLLFPCFFPALQPGGILPLSRPPFNNELNDKKLMFYSWISVIGDRLTNFHIGTTNDSPQTIIPEPENYDICHTQDTALGNGETKSFDCKTKGRYLIIQFNDKAEHLNLCDVKVFGGKSIHFYCYPRFMIFQQLMTSVTSQFVSDQ